MAFYFGQIWSFIRFMVFGNLESSGKELKLRVGANISHYEES
jgi:hypothetical protein